MQPPLPQELARWTRRELFRQAALAVLGATVAFPGVGAESASREEIYRLLRFVTMTGEGSSDPHYAWGALMALIAVEELIDANPWHDLQFGNLHPVESGEIERYPVADSLYPGAVSGSRMGKG